MAAGGNVCGGAPHAARQPPVRTLPRRIGPGPVTEAAFDRIQSAKARGAWAIPLPHRTSSRDCAAGLHGGGDVFFSSAPFTPLSFSFPELPALWVSLALVPQGTDADETSMAADSNALAVSARNKRFRTVR